MIMNINIIYLRVDNIYSLVPAFSCTQGQGFAGANPSCHSTKAGIHSGQVASWLDDTKQTKTIA